MKVLLFTFGSVESDDMSRNRIALLFTALTLGCVAGPLSGQSGADNMPVVTVSEGESGRTIEVPSDGKLILRLPAQMGTGHVWTLVKSDDKVLRLAAKNVESNQNLPGGKDSQVFDFSPVSAGKTQIELVYKQPWKREQAPEKVVRYNVVVRD